MATTKIGVEVDLDPSGVQRGAAAASSAIDKLANNRTGINKLDNAFKDLGQNALNLPGSFGRLADALLDFAPAGLVGSAVIGGIGAIVYVMNQQKQRQEEVAKSSKELSSAVEAQRLAYIKATQGVEAYNQELERSNIIIAQTAVTEATTALVKFEEETRKSIDARVRSLQQLNRLAAGGEGAGRTIAEQVNRESVAISVRNDRLVESNNLIKNLADANASLLEATAAQRENETNRIKRADEAAAKSAVDAENARKKALQETITQYRQLYELNTSGAQLTEEQQNKLTSQIDVYRAAIDNVNLSLEERLIALQAINQLESDIQKRQDEIERARKQREDDEKRAAKEREDAQKKVFDEAIRSQEQYLNNIAITTSAAADAFNLLFSAIGQGGNALANLGQGFLQIFSSLARNKVAENIAYAVENYAKAFGNTAIGNLVGAAANKAAAAGHLKAAALWGALAGVGSAGSAAIAGNAAGGGAGGAGRGFSQSQVGGIQGESGNLFITIQGGGVLDMNNPETARAFARALETATSRRIVISRG